MFLFYHMPLVLLAYCCLNSRYFVLYLFLFV